MATPAATKRLTKEYASLAANPPPYIITHPSESNILEWHYILTGPADSPYHGGQYWGTLVFPPNYPFAPPAIRMHTPSGRFQPSQRLCLTISDFHPKSFNPAWGVSTILTALLSFMTGDEITTGGVRAADAERRLLARRSRWWNSTGGGSLPAAAASAALEKAAAREHARTKDGSGGGGTGTESKDVIAVEDLPLARATTGRFGADALGRGDQGARFRAEWPALDGENWVWLRAHRVDPATGAERPRPAPSAPQSTRSSDADETAGEKGSGGLAACSPEAAALRRRPPRGVAGSGVGYQAVVGGGQVARQAGGGWVARNKLVLGIAVVFGYVILARVLGDGRAS